VTEWKKLGVRSRTGGPLPNADIPAALISGGKRHFLVYPNYQAILEYNCVNAYALSVGLLADATGSSSTAVRKTSSTTKASSKKK
jgi:membrane-bound lytic murein transglycosylase B